MVIEIIIIIEVEEITIIIIMMVNKISIEVEEKKEGIIEVEVIEEDMEDKKKKQNIEILLKILIK